jgi:ATP-dependent Clp protease, protease subunit
MTERNAPLNPFQLATLAQHATMSQRPYPMNMPAGASPSGGGFNRYREMTLEELLLENRTLFLVGEINHASASRLLMQMLYLESLDNKKDINLYINSPGGVVDDTLAVYDIMRVLKCPVATYCVGRAMSGGAVMFAAGAKGKRFILPNAKIMIHQPYGGIGGQASDIFIQAEEITKTKRLLNEILAKHTGQTVERVEADAERDKFFNAQEALAYGLADDILSGGAA